jgi:hypothetical protein
MKNKPIINNSCGSTPNSQPFDESSRAPLSFFVLMDKDNTDTVQLAQMVQQLYKILAHICEFEDSEQEFIESLEKNVHEELEINNPTIHAKIYHLIKSRELIFNRLEMLLKFLQRTI